MTDITNMTDTELDALLGLDDDATEEEAEETVAERVDRLLAEARAARVGYHNHRHARRMARGGI